MSQGVGSKTADSMVSLFSLLKSGELKEKQNRQSTTTQKPKPAMKATKSNSEKTKTLSSASPHVATSTEEVKHSIGTSNRPNLHIDLQIHISPESTPEQIETIFACMAKHLYGVENL